ncbi:unnamed protein product, partial [Discosporangium mesarthrocarpum]
LLCKKPLQRLVEALGEASTAPWSGGASFTSRVGLNRQQASSLRKLHQLWAAVGHTASCSEICSREVLSLGGGAGGSGRSEVCRQQELLHIQRLLRIAELGMSLIEEEEAVGGDGGEREGSAPPLRSTNHRPDTEVAVASHQQWSSARLVMSEAPTLPPPPPGGVASESSGPVQGEDVTLGPSGRRGACKGRRRRNGRGQGGVKVVAQLAR